MSKESTFVLAAICLAIYSSTVSASDLEYMPGELLVKFAPKANGEQLTKVERNSVLASLGGGTIKHSYKHVAGLTRVKLEESDTVENALGRFMGRVGGSKTGGPGAGGEFVPFVGAQVHRGNCAFWRIC